MEFLSCHLPSNTKCSVLILYARGGQPVKTNSHFSYCVTAKSRTINVGTHEHHTISSLFKHDSLNLLSYIYFKYHTPTWQGQKFTSHLLLCMLFSGTSETYVRTAWNWAKRHMRFASRGLVTTALCYGLMVKSMKTSFVQQSIVATPLANHMK